MTSITDKPMIEKTDEELFILQARSFQQGDGQYFLIENMLKRRLVEKQHELSKVQIELQHKHNMDLMNKQLRWIKFSAILNAIALLAAVLLGFFLQELKSTPNPSPSTQQSIQSQIKPSTSASHSEKITDKVPLRPPIKAKHE